MSSPSCARSPPADCHHVRGAGSSAAEQGTFNPRVVGSNPTRPSSLSRVEQTPRGAARPEEGRLTATLTATAEAIGGRGRWGRAACPRAAAPVQDRAIVTDATALESIPEPVVGVPEWIEPTRERSGPTSRGRVRGCGRGHEVRSEGASQSGRGLRIRRRLRPPPLVPEDRGDVLSVRLTCRELDHQTLVAACIIGHRPREAGRRPVPCIGVLSHTR